MADPYEKVLQQQALNELELAKKQQLNSLDYEKAAALAQLQESQNLAKLGANRRETGIPMLDAFDVYLTQERADNPFSIASQAIRKTKLPQSDNVWENLGGNLLQGLGGGLFNELGDMGVQSSFEEELLPTLRDAYPQAKFGDSGASVTPEVARMAVIDALTEQKRKDSLLETALQRGNPRLVEALISGEFDMPSMAGQKEEAPQAGFAGEETINQKRVRLSKDYLDAGVSPSAVTGLVNADLAAERESAKDIVDAAGNTLEKAKKTQTLAENAGRYMEQAKDLMGPSAIDKVKRFGYQQLASDSPEYQAIQGLQTLQADIISAARDKGTGTVSDYEDKMYLASGITENLTYESASELKRRLENVAQAQKEKAIFEKWYLSEGGNPLRVEDTWDRVVQKYPKYIPSDGKLVPNPNKPSLDTIISELKTGNLPEVKPRTLADVADPLAKSPSGLPAGAVDTGRTSKGRPVYKLPDGRLVRG